MSAIKDALAAYEDCWKEYAIDYFSDYERDEAGKIIGKPSIVKFFKKLGILDHRAIAAVREAHPDFNETLAYCQDTLLVDVIDNGALVGAYNAGYAQFYLNTRHNIVPRGDITGAMSLNEEDRALLRNVLERLEGSGEDDE